MSGPRPTARDPRPTARDPRPAGRRPRPAPDTTGDVVRWAAFSCVLVPVVLLWYGTSLAGTAGTALGLAAVTAVCRFLLRRSERTTAPRGGGRHTRGTKPDPRSTTGTTPVD